MERDKAEQRRQKNQRQPRDESRSALPATEPVNPLIVDGPEAVRDSHC